MFKPLALLNQLTTSFTSMSYSRAFNKTKAWNTLVNLFNSYNFYIKLIMSNTDIEFNP
jgi:hypothetical protein